MPAQITLICQTAVSPQNLIRRSNYRNRPRRGLLQGHRQGTSGGTPRRQTGRHVPDKAVHELQPGDAVCGPGRQGVPPERAGERGRPDSPREGEGGREGVQGSGLLDQLLHKQLPRSVFREWTECTDFAVAVQRTEEWG